MKGIYLGACRAFHFNYDLDYNDIVSGYHCNIICDMLKVNLKKYDYIIATPPCNFWSRARGNKLSNYSLSTKHLLPFVLVKCILSGKPFIVENVRNSKAFFKYGIYEIANKNGIFIYEYGRHTYFTNIMINFNGVEQRQDFKNHGYRINYNDKLSKYNQGGFNVHNCIEHWLKFINF